MNFVELFIRRPVATTLLTLGVALAGAIAFKLLPVAPLPQVDFPTISVSASLPGASPEVMAATVAMPLERALGRIAGVTEITSGSSLGNTRITVQFDLNRDVNNAAREVQAAIQAARSQLPTSLPNNPTYRKLNPADAPIMILALTSDTLTQGQMYDIASTVLAQKIAQVKGVGQVQVGGSSLPAVRVELNPTALNKYGIGFDDVRSAIQATNANRPKGFLEGEERQWQIYANDQAKTAAEYIPLIVTYRNGAAVRLGDLADVVDSVQDVRNAGIANGKPSVVLIISRQPNANIIETVAGVQALLPQLQATIPASVQLSTMLERTSTIVASLREVEKTLVISISLVIMVVSCSFATPAPRSSPRWPCRYRSSAPSASCILPVTASTISRSWRSPSRPGLSWTMRSSCWRTSRATWRRARRRFRPRSRAPVRWASPLYRSRSRSSPYSFPSCSWAASWAASSANSP